jgi:hypothetical protein
MSLLTQKAWQQQAKGMPMGQKDCRKNVAGELGLQVPATMNCVS